MALQAPSEEELNQLLEKTSLNKFRQKYVTINNFILPERYLQVKNALNSFEVNDSDVWICGFPKTGTTWISEIAWLILNDLDYEGAKEVQYNRIRMLEFSMLFDSSKECIFGGVDAEVDSINHAKVQESPRIIKSHLPFPLLPKQIREGTKKPKIIYTARNPMDTCISYYHQCRNFEFYSGTLEEFCKLFLFDKVNYGPYPSHVLTFWERRHNPNILFLTYEQMKRDLSGVIQKVADFLGKNVSFEESLKLQQYVSFDSMKNNSSINKQEFLQLLEDRDGLKRTPFIRNGKTGEYKIILSQEMIHLFQNGMGKIFEKIGLDFLEDNLPKQKVFVV